jgi:hypothetical protein
MISLASAFLVCTMHIGMHNFHPHTFELLEAAENKYITLNNAIRGIALLDSERGIPLAECLLEQSTVGVSYKGKYPEPPYLGNEAGAFCCLKSGLGHGGKR